MFMLNPFRTCINTMIFKHLIVGLSIDISNSPEWRNHANIKRYEYNNLCYYHPRSCCWNIILLQFIIIISIILKSFPKI